MAHLKKWVWRSVVALSLILPSSELFAGPSDSDPVVAPQRNTFICHVNGKGSAEIAVILDDSILSELGRQLKKKKQIDTSTNLAAANWIETSNDCHQPSDAVKVNELCLDSTYQCAYDKHSGKSTKNVGLYHGFLPLNRDDLNDLTSGWDKLVGGLKKSGKLGTRIKDALHNRQLEINYIPDYVRPILNDGSRTYPDPFTTSPCLQQFLVYGSTSKAQALDQQKEAKRQDKYEKDIQKNQYNPAPFVKHEQQALTGEQLLIANKKNQADSIELECGQQEGEAADSAKARERALWRSTQPKEPVKAEPVDLKMVEYPECARIRNVTPGDLHVPDDCSYVRGCAEKILQNTCQTFGSEACGWRTCLQQYEKFCRDAGCLKGSASGGSRASAGSGGDPKFNMADVTGRAIKALNTLNDEDLDCGLRDEWKKFDKDADQDTEAKESFSRNCKKDQTSLRYLLKVLNVFNESASGKSVNVNYEATDPNFFKHLRSYVSTFASSRPNLDPEVKASLLQIASTDNFLDWLQNPKNEGGKYYLGHSHTTTVTSIMTNPTDLGWDSFQILNNIDAAAGNGEASPVSCLFHRPLQAPANQKAYFGWITDDYTRARNLKVILDGPCSSAESAPVAHPKAKTSGTTR